MEHPKFQETRKQIISNFENYYDQHYKLYVQAASISIISRTDYAQKERDLQRIIEDSAAMSANMIEQLKIHNKEASMVLQEIRKAAAEQGVSQQATYFNTESEDQARNAKRWGGITLGLGVLLVICSGCILLGYPKLSYDSTPGLVSFITGKIFLLGALLYFVTLSAKNFMAHKHNSIVNRHRRNSLSTYKALVEAASENVNRDIVLGRAADCIFGAQPTGFAKESREDNRSSPLLQISPSLIRGSKSES